MRNEYICFLVARLIALGREPQIDPDRHAHQSLVLMAAIEDVGRFARMRDTPAHRRAPRQLLEPIIQAGELPVDRRQRLHECHHAHREYRIVRHRLMRRLGKLLRPLPRVI